MRRAVFWIWQTGRWCVQDYVPTLERGHNKMERRSALAGLCEALFPRRSVGTGQNPSVDRKYATYAGAKSLGDVNRIR